jgi:hypothetical protein
MVNPASAKQDPISIACWYSSVFSPHLDPPKIVTIFSVGDALDI